MLIASRCIKTAVIFNIFLFSRGSKQGARSCSWNDTPFKDSFLPSHLFGRWTQSSSPPSLAAPTDRITQTKDKTPDKIISSALTKYLPSHKNVLEEGNPTKVSKICGFHMLALFTRSSKIWKSQLPPLETRMLGYRPIGKGVVAALNQLD